MEWQIITRNRLFVLGLGALLLTTGCKTSLRSSSSGTYPLGSQAALPPLIFTGLETEWRDQLESPEGPRMPKDRYLLVTISVTNSGGETHGVPMLTLEDSKGNSYPEEQKGDGVPQWLGFLRTIQPAQTERGQLLFDVPPGAYRLRVTSGGDPETEKSALIELPFNPDRPADGGLGHDSPAAVSPAPKQ